MWAKLKPLTLKDQNDSGGLNNSSRQDDADALKEVLHYPNPVPQRKTLGNTASLPPHISGDEVVDVLEAKMKEREEAEEEKM